MKTLSSQLSIIAAGSCKAKRVTCGLTGLSHPQNVSGNCLAAEGLIDLVLNITSPTQRASHAGSGELLC